MSETPQFHPEIEKALETSGENIGRVKDIPLAQDIANETKDSLDFRDTSDFYFGDREPFNERDKERQNSAIKNEIAKRAVTKKFDDTMSDAVVLNTLYDTLIWNGWVSLTDHEKKIRLERLQDEAKAVGEDYDKLEHLAENARQNRTDHLKVQSVMPSNEEIRDAVDTMSRWYEAHKDDDTTPDGLWKTITSGLAYHLGFIELKKDGATFSSLTPEQMTLVQDLYHEVVGRQNGAIDTDK